MTQDKELFELGEQVFKRLGWVHHTRFVDGKMVYEFTSDYLLEKLPKGVSVVKEQLTDNYNAGLPRVTRLVSDTPLKALLKLTLALHEAGELK